MFHVTPVFIDAKQSLTDRALWRSSATRDSLGEEQHSYNLSLDRARALFFIESFFGFKAFEPSYLLKKTFKEKLSLESGTKIYLTFISWYESKKPNMISFIFLD